MRRGRGAKPRRMQKGEREMAAELQARRDEVAEWEPVEVEKSMQRGVLTSFRLPALEFVALQKAAQASGETLSEFIRSAVALRLHGKPVPTAVQISSGAQEVDHRATFLVPVLSAGQTENPTLSVPDLPPPYANIV